MLGLKLQRAERRVRRRALRATGCSCVPAGDNVVRLLPPLIVSEAEIDEARRAGSTRRCAALERRRSRERGASAMVRHFLDLADFDAATLRAHPRRRAGA